MNWLDTVIILLLVLAAWQGWRQGVVTQLFGLVAVVLGIFLGWRFGADIGAWFGLKGSAATFTGFVAVLVAVVLGVALVGRFTRGLFRVVGLGVFDNLLGVLFSVLKMWLFAGLVVMLVCALDVHGRVISQHAREGSAMYQTFEGCLRGLF